MNFERGSRQREPLLLWGTTVSRGTFFSFETKKCKDKIRTRSNFQIDFDRICEGAENAPKTLYAQILISSRFRNHRERFVLTSTIFLTNLEWKIQSDDQKRSTTIIFRLRIDIQLDTAESKSPESLLALTLNVLENAKFFALAY